MAVNVAAANADLVRRHDPDRFLLSLLAPAETRADLWALYAFNHEIAKTREVVTETRLGLIRLQWWRDALAGVYAGSAIPEHPVVQGLAEAIRKHGLPQEQFDSLVYAREFDLEDRLPATLEGTVKYAEFTSLPLFELARQIAAPDTVADLKGLAVGYALTGLLRATASHLSQRRCYLPADRLPMIHRQYDGRELEALQPAAQEVAEAAFDFLAASPRLALPKFMRGHRKLAHMWLKRIKKYDFNVLDPRLQAPPFLRELRLLWS